MWFSSSCFCRAFSAIKWSLELSFHSLKHVHFFLSGSLFLCLWMQRNQKWSSAILPFLSLLFFWFEFLPFMLFWLEELEMEREYVSTCRKFVHCSILEQVNGNCLFVFFFGFLPFLSLSQQPNDRETLSLWKDVDSFSLFASVFLLLLFGCWDKWEK